jgi:hypothetical protein
MPTSTAMPAPSSTEGGSCSTAASAESCDQPPHWSAPTPWSGPRTPAVATAKGRRISRPPVVDPDKLAYAVHLDAGHRIAEIVAKSGIARTSLYRQRKREPTTGQHRSDAVSLPGKWYGQ